MVPRPDDAWVAGPRRVDAHIVQGHRAPRVVRGLRPISEVWPVQHGPPARFPCRTVAGPYAQIRIRSSDCSHALTVLRSSDRRLSALPSLYPLLKCA